MRKMSYESQLQFLKTKYSWFYDYSKDVLDSMSTELEQAYNLDVNITPFFASDNVTKESVMKGINKQLHGIYGTKLHNVGPGGVDKYYQTDSLVPDWMKIAQYLISFMWFKGIDSSNISNTTLAIKVGWLSDKEKNTEVIKKASRKVSDALHILNHEMNLFDVEQRYRDGISGSYHIITANWIQIITTYRNTETLSEMDIRFNKTVKYRIVSFIKRTQKRWSDAMKALIQSQKNKYLTKIIKYDLDDFRRSRTWFNLIAETYKRRFKRLYILKDYPPRYFVPEVHHPIITLNIKDEILYQEVLKIEDELKTVIYNDLGLELNLVRL